jgi:hypothetical protein
VGRQKGGPALAGSVEASFCLDFFLSFCGNDKKKNENFQMASDFNVLMNPKNNSLY